MGKYFKEEETSNSIKRFKTSHVQEKNLKFAQMSRVVTTFDKFLDFTRILFKTWIRTSKLIKVKPEILQKLKDEFDTIVGASRALAIQKQKKISALEKLIKVAEDRKDVLRNEIRDTAGDARNAIITEFNNINKYLEKINTELKPLKEEFTEIEKTTKAEIDAKIQEFNSNNGLVTQLSWNGDLVNPKMDFLLPTGLSQRGVGSALFRMRPGKKMSELGFLNFTRRNLSVALDAKVKEILIDNLNKIGFYKDTFIFTIKEGDKFKEVNLTLYKLLENLASGKYKSDKIAIKDEQEREKLNTAFSKFLETLDKTEKGWSTSGFLKQLATIVGGIYTVHQLSNFLGIKILPMIATLPQAYKRHTELNDPNKMNNDMNSANQNLGIGDYNERTIKELERALQDPSMDAEFKPMIQRKINKLRGGK